MPTSCLRIPEDQIPDIDLWEKDLSSDLFQKLRHEPPAKEESSVKPELICRWYNRSGVCHWLKSNDKTCFSRNKHPLGAPLQSLTFEFPTKKKAHITQRPINILEQSISSLPTFLWWTLSKHLALWSMSRFTNVGRWMFLPKHQLYTSCSHGSFSLQLVPKLHYIFETSYVHWSFQVSISKHTRIRSPKNRLFFHVTSKS